MAELRRASTVLHRSKSISAFARDGYYIGTNYEVTGPKDREVAQRRGAGAKGGDESAVWGVSFNV